VVNGGAGQADASCGREESGSFMASGIVYPTDGRTALMEVSAVYSRTMASRPIYSASADVIVQSGPDWQLY